MEFQEKNAFEVYWPLDLKSLDFYRIDAWNISRKEIPMTLDEAGCFSERNSSGYTDRNSFKEFCCCLLQSHNSNQRQQFLYYFSISSIEILSKEQTATSHLVSKIRILQEFFLWAGMCLMRVVEAKGFSFYIVKKFRPHCGICVERQSTKAAGRV